MKLIPQYFFTQAESAIFRVHRYLLAQRSSVLSDMFRTPQQEGGQDRTDAKPLCRKLVRPELGFTSDELIAFLRIAHKYFMEAAEEEIVSHLRTLNSKEGFINLIDVSRIVGSRELQEEAIRGLRRKFGIFTPARGGFVMACQRVPPLILDGSEDAKARHSMPLHDPQMPKYARACECETLVWLRHTMAWHGMAARLCCWDK